MIVAKLDEEDGLKLKEEGIFICFIMVLGRLKELLKFELEVGLITLKFS